MMNLLKLFIVFGIISLSSCSSKQNEYVNVKFEVIDTLRTYHANIFGGVMKRHVIIQLKDSTYHYAIINYDGALKYCNVENINDKWKLKK